MITPYTPKGINASKHIVSVVIRPKARGSTRSLSFAKAKKTYNTIHTIPTTRDQMAVLRAYHQNVLPTRLYERISCHEAFDQ